MRDMSFSFPSAMKGFTLLEVLVAVVVLAIGILGLVGLQTSSLKQNQSAMTRTVAVEYANAIMDKMRSNPKEAAMGYYITLNGARPSGIPEDSQANKDVTLWYENLKKSLPGRAGDVKVQVCNVKGESAHGGKCGTEGDYAMVCIRWDQAGGNADPLFEKDTQQFSLVGRI